MNNLEVINVVMNHGSLILAVALGLSETLALLPFVRANSLFQLVYGGIKRLAGK